MYRYRLYIDETGSNEIGSIDLHDQTLVELLMNRVQFELCGDWITDPSGKHFMSFYVVPKVMDEDRLNAYLDLIEKERSCRPSEAMLADEIRRLRKELNDRTNGAPT